MSNLLLVRCCMLLVATLLGGCGFTMRGSAELPPALQTLVLESANPGSDLTREARRALRNSKVTLLDAGDAAIYRLDVGAEETSERVLSVNANARAGEYEVIMQAPFQLRQGGEVVFGPEVFRVTRVYLADPENAVAKSEEALLIRTELRRELTQQVLRRLQVLEF